MAWIGIRSGLGKVVSLSSNKSLLCINIKGLLPIQAAGISGSALRDKTKVRPKPFPYKTKRYNFWRAWLQDTTTHRFDENTKVIVVEGPVAAGKTDFAKKLAEDLDMLHMPEVTMDDVYINPYGYDMRQLDPTLPPYLRSYDEKDFCRNPNLENAATLQVTKYYLKFSQYVDALAHVLNTGQGVVLERCPYSDFVFLESMYKAGYVSETARDIYYDIKNNTIGELMKPHLVIYLDVPVAAVQQKIKERNLPHEVNSKVISNEYLTNMEFFYKQRYLKDISVHSELLIYDWTNQGDVEIIVEDIERIDFDNYELYSKKMRDWRLPDEWAFNSQRITYTADKDELLMMFNIPRFDAPECNVDGYDVKLFYDKWYSAPGMKYDLEFNEDQGDKNLLFKLNKSNYRKSVE